MGTPQGNAGQVRTGPGRILIGPYGTDLPTDFGASGAAPSLDTDLVEIGFTTEGSELEISQESEGVEVAERKNPIRYEDTSSEAAFRFVMAQINPENLKIALSGGTIETTANGAQRYTFPKTSGSDRFSVVWEAEDGKEYLVLAKCSSTGTVTIPRRKGTEAASVPVEFRVEENSEEDILLGANIMYLVHPDLASA